MRLRMDESLPTRPAPPAAPSAARPPAAAGTSAAPGCAAPFRLPAPLSLLAAAGGRTLAEHLISDEDTSVFAILMPSNFTMKEGAPLWPGVQLGKFLGAGAQVGRAPRVLASGCRSSAAWPPV
jgi:hypothetical protein